MVTKSMLFEYFTGNSSVLQKRMIENWLENEKNRNLYYEWLAEWESEYPQYVTDVENKLDEYLSKIENAKKHTLSTTHNREIGPTLKKYHFLILKMHHSEGSLFENSQVISGHSLIKQI
jgi:thiaminase